MNLNNIGLARKLTGAIALLLAAMLLIGGFTFYRADRIAREASSSVEQAQMLIRKSVQWQGLTQTAVSSYLEVRCRVPALLRVTNSQVEKRMSQGTINRTTASTLMNETSSRSHMVIIIKFKQVSPQRMPWCL